MSNMLMLHVPIHLVCKFIIFNVYFTKDNCLMAFNFEDYDKCLAKCVKHAHVTWTYILSI